MPYEIKITEHVTDDDHGFGWEIRPDGDGVRVRYIEIDGKLQLVDTVNDDAVPHVACSMLRVCWNAYPNTRAAVITELERTLAQLLGSLPAPGKD